MKISVIIPTCDEASSLLPLLSHIKGNIHPDNLAEVIVVDGKSSYNTLKVARNQGACAIPCRKKGKVAQMNYGAKIATGEILYFVQTEALPPDDFAEDIIDSVQHGINCGEYCFSTSQKYNFLYIKRGFFNPFIHSMRFKEQSLFITRDQFVEAGGFKELTMVR